MVESNRKHFTIGHDIALVLFLKRIDFLVQIVKVYNSIRNFQNY